MKKGFSPGQYEDLRGKRFGGLVVIDEEPFWQQCKTSNRKFRRWKCECRICGRVVDVQQDNLKKNPIGCRFCSRKRNAQIGAEKARIYADSNVGGFYGFYRGNAKRRGLEFALSVEEFQALIRGDCFYCGNPPRVYVAGRFQLLMNGIDRKDSSLGYVENNCVACCSPCNLEKRRMSFDEWRKRLAARRRKQAFISSDVLLYL